MSLRTGNRGKRYKRNYLSLTQRRAMAVHTYMREHQLPLERAILQVRKKSREVVLDNLTRLHVRR